MTIDDHHIIKKLHLDDLLQKIDSLPTLPEVAVNLLRAIDQEDIDISVLTQKIAYDQSLTAKILRLANSAFSGIQTKVTTIQQAISLLGINMVRNLITATALSSCFPENRCRGFDFKAFWRHSIGTAICAKLLARQLQLNQDFAFTGGLLHDIGKLVLVTCYPQHYERAIAYRDAHDCNMLDAERSMLGIDHMAAGNALAMHWNFSEVIRHAIIGHHDPDAIGSSSVASLLNVADAIAHALDFNGTDDDIVPPVSLAAWHSVGLDEQTYMQVFRQTELQFEEMSKVFML